jgi:hypothetical protein
LKLKDVVLLSSFAVNVNLRRCTSGAYLANCFVKHLGNCIVPAACNLDDLAAAMEVIDALDMRHTRQGGY